MIAAPITSAGRCSPLGPLGIVGTAKFEKLFFKKLTSLLRRLYHIIYTARILPLLSTLQHSLYYPFTPKFNGIRVARSV